jgi:dihydrofolate reductase
MKDSVIKRHTTTTKTDMRKIIAAINMTLDGVFDHTAGLPDEEIHQHYTELLGQGDAILYGRTTYHLMEFWRTVLANPSDKKSMNDFAIAIDKIPKIVFSRTIKNVEWKTATVAKRDLKDEVLELRQPPGKDILVGSRSLIIQLIKLNLIDELQLCVYPVIAGDGLSLFENINDRIIYKLVKNKTFKSGAVILYYQPKNE